MYYHIEMWARNRTLIMRTANLEWELVQDRVLPAYQRGDPLTLDGRTVSTYDIGRITILETDHEVNPMASYHDDSLREMGYTYTTEERDVTNRWITGPPGHARLNADDTSGQSSLEAGGPETPTVPQIEHSRPGPGTREVFVVHGRNTPAQEALFEFLRAIDLHPLEWSEAVGLTGKASPYVGEVLDAAFSRAHAVVVLLSPDDEARLRQPFREPNDPAHEITLTGQARPNVLFEAGMAMSWSEERTVLVQIGDVRPFSDIGGRHVLRLSDTSESRQQLAQRLANAGCPVQQSGTMWHSAGNFAAALELTEVSEALEEEIDIGTISIDARRVLSRAAASRDGMIYRLDVMGGSNFQAGSETFGEIGNPREAARWQQAVDDLVAHGLVKPGPPYELTHNGFEAADQLEDG